MARVVGSSNLLNYPNNKNILACSTMVVQSAVNRSVVGSSPTKSANNFYM